MVPGVVARLEVGSDLHLAPEEGDPFPIAITQWQEVDRLLREARGVVVAKPEFVRPLWLVLQNANEQPIPVAWVYYRIGLKTGLTSFSYVIRASLALENVPARGGVKLAMLDLGAWDTVEAEVTTVTAEPLPELPAEGTNPEHAIVHRVGPRDLRVVVYCPTGASFSQAAQVEFNLPRENAKVRFRHPTERETLCITRHHGLPGLIAVVDLFKRSGDLLGHAFDATTICDGVVSTAFALTLADMRESFPVLVCDNTPGLQERPFIHFFTDQVVMGRRANLDPEQWSREAAPMLEKSSKRVVRAIRWLRKMHTEDDILDRFLAGWTGLETLNPQLCEHFGIEASADDVRACGKCGEKVVRKVPRANGLKELFVREGKQDVYDACSKARNGLVHGFQDISDVTVVAREHASAVGLMLAKGIQILAKVHIPTDPEKFKWLAGYRVASLVFVEGTMNCGELTDYENRRNDLPLFEYVIKHEGGVVGEKTVLNGKANIGVPPECTLTVKGMGVSGPVQITNLQAE